MIGKLRVVETWDVSWLSERDPRFLVGRGDTPCSSFLKRETVTIIAHHADERVFRSVGAPGINPFLTRTLCIVVLTTFLLIGALARPLNHDESQYIASAILARSGLPYRDFDYFQTPLQPILFAPLTMLWPEHVLIVLRMVNAAMAAFSVLFLAAALQKSGCTRQRALNLALLLAASEPFLFGASTMRNDMLPCLLECAALSTLMSIRLRKEEQANVLAALLGALLAAACAAKISYAFPLAAVVLGEILARRRGYGQLSLRAFAAGAFLPLAFVAGLALQSPHFFWFDVIHFPAAAPREWYGAGHNSGKLALLGRTKSYLEYLALGPAPLFIFTLLFRRVSSRKQNPDIWSATMLDTMLGAAVLASILTVPVWRQYLLPVLPLLILRTGPLISQGSYGRRAGIILGGLCAAGLGLTISYAVTAMQTGFPVVNADRDANVIRRMLTHRAFSGPIASLSPERVADAGFALDPRFAAGPFLFRTKDGLGEADSLIGVTRTSYFRRLQQMPPAGIITGGEALDSGAAALDGMLSSWAIENRYIRLGITPEGMTIYIRPAARVGSAIARS